MKHLNVVVPFYRETLNAVPNPFPTVVFSSALNTAGEVSLLSYKKTQNLQQRATMSADRAICFHKEVVSRLIYRSVFI